MRLRNEYSQSQNDKGKKQAVHGQQAFAGTSSWPSHHETSDTFSSLVGAFGSLPGSSLESCSNGYLSISNSNLYPPSSATSGEVWDDGLGGKSSTARGFLGTSRIPDLGQEASSTANESSMYPNLEHQPDVWTAYEPPQPVLEFEQAWGEGEHAARLGRPQHGAKQQTANANHAVFNFDDPFWNNMLTSSGDFVLESGMNIGQANSKPAHSL